MRSQCASALLVGAALAGLACAPLSVPEERRLGFEFEQQLRGQLVFVQDETVVDYVRSLGADLVSDAGPQPCPYHFYVVYDDEINAFAGPAGHVYVHTETILRARSAAELAGVIAHEVGHVALRHVAANYNRARNTRIGTDLLTLGAGVLAGGAAADATALGTGLAAAGYLNSFGREAEHEADVFAVATLERAGWDPEGLVTFFQLLAAEGGGSQGLTFLSSHPTTAERIARTRALVDALGDRSALRRDDGGRFGLIQRRIDLVTGRFRLPPR